MELRFARARPLFRLRSAYADPKVPFRGIYETDRGNGKAAVSRCVAVSRRGAVSRCRQASRRGYVADVPLPGDCHATATPSLAMTRRYGCTLGWRRGEGAPPLPKRKTTFQTNTCHRWLPDGRTRASSPTYPIECKYGRSLLARAGSAHIAALAQKKRSERFCRSDRFS